MRGSWARRRRVTANFLSNQGRAGSWPKNLDTATEPYRRRPVQDPGDLRQRRDRGRDPIPGPGLRRDRRAAVREAFLKGLDLILAAPVSRPAACPQTSPPGKGYARHITFNDSTMVNLLELLRDVAGAGRLRVRRPTNATRRPGRRSTRGIACILACQVKVNGKLTVWCAQHDEVTLEPRGARTFELVSLSGSRERGDPLAADEPGRPGPEVVRAVEAGVRWFEASKLDRHPPGGRQRRQGDRAPTRPPRRSGRGSTRSTRTGRSSAAATA